MDELGLSYKVKKSEREKQILHMNAYMWNAYTCIYGEGDFICKGETEIQM